MADRTPHSHCFPFCRGGRTIVAVKEKGMATMIRDVELEQRLQAERAACGADRYDEIWEGVYVMAPMLYIHQRPVYIKDDISHHISILLVP